MLVFAFLCSAHRRRHGVQCAVAPSRRRRSLDLTAEEGLVWFRDENKVVATGNARAIRSGVELRADTLVAHYREGPDGGGNQFHRVVADGNVQIISKNEKVYGDRGEYKIDDQNFVLVGGNLRIESDQGLITARDQLEYWEAKQQFVARGDATITKEDQNLRQIFYWRLLGRTGAESKKFIKLTCGGMFTFRRQPRSYARKKACIMSGPVS